MSFCDDIINSLRRMKARRHYRERMQRVAAQNQLAALAYRDPFDRSRPAFWSILTTDEIARATVEGRCEFDRNPTARRK